MATDYRVKKLSIKLLQSHSKRYIHQNTGFTLIEMLVVILMVGILSAIAAPSWLGFVNRQRVNKASDAVVSAIRQAQTEAKNKKLSYSVSFRVNSDNIPEYIIYQGTTTPGSGWIALGDNLGLKSRQVFLYTNLTASNTITADKQIVQTTPGTGTITFDYFGVLANKSSNVVSDTPLAVMVAVPKTTGAASGSKRCVIIRGLLAGMQTQKDTECDDLK